MEQNPPIPKRNKLHALAFLEVGLVEIGFVIIILLLLFGTLNYLNILPVSDVFPKQLGWFPRREVPTGTSQQSNNLTIQQSAVPIPTPFAYSTALAETLLKDYIKDNIKPELLPADFEKITPSQFAQNPNYFVQPFTAQNASVSAYFRYNKETNSANSFSISINIKSETSIGSAAVNSLLSSYFIKPYLNPECKGDANFTFCENFQSSPEDKTGYGIQILKKLSGTVMTVFSCQIPKESSDYSTAKSCASF